MTIKKHLLDATGFRHTCPQGHDMTEASGNRFLISTNRGSTGVSHVHARCLICHGGRYAKAIASREAEAAVLKARAARRAPRRPLATIFDLKPALFRECLHELEEAMARVAPKGRPPSGAGAARSQRAKANRFFGAPRL